MTTPFILFLDSIGSADLPKVGGKGANLGELTQAGFNIPPGFCVSVHAFARFIATRKREIYANLDEVSGDNLEHVRLVGAKVRGYLAGIPLPPDVADSVVKAWSNLGEDHAYAVRSSATAEDLPSASFAGQQDTYLNVRGQEALLEKIKSCFLSLFPDRAILYRIQNGFDHRQVALAVIVQRMVQPDVSGILFTADPVTGNRNIVSIDASFGLGEALVSGLVSADLYQVDKQTNRIIKRQIATKHLAVRSVANGGTVQVELEPSQQTQAALTDAQALELADLSSRIEAHYGMPQDIEWALADNYFSITQSRPITSLYPLPEPKPSDGALHTYVSLSHFQVMTDAMPPLALSVLRTILPIGRTIDQLESPYIHTAGGRLYIDYSPILRHPLGRRLMLKIFKNADQLVVNALTELIDRPSFLSHGKRFNPLRLLPAAYPYILKMARILFWEQSEGVTSKSTNIIDDYIAAVQKKLNATNQTQAKLAIIVSAIRNINQPFLTWAPYLGAGLIATTLLKVLFGKRGFDQELTALERGLSGNIATEMNLAVGDLADIARAEEALKTSLTQTHIDAQTRLAHAADAPNGATFMQAWNDFLHRYGARGPSEIDLSRPRWSEDPTSLLQMIVNVMRQSEPNAHRIYHQKLRTEAEKAAQTLSAAAQQGWWGWIRGPLTRRLIRVSRNLISLREHHKFLAIQLFAYVKTVFREAGEQLTLQGRIRFAEDIWFLTLPDVITAFDTPKLPLQRYVIERRSAFEQYQHLTPPRVITSTGEIPIVKLTEPEVPEGALVGSPVSAGVVEGIAKVVLNPSVAILNPGEILIAPFTDPGWTPLFVNAAGLVTEVGGLMTHGSVVAREYGIPAVVGVLNATKRIKTGQRVRVHGAAGYIELLNTNDHGAEGTVI